MALTIPPLPRSTILLVEVGSTAHGTGLPGGEDLDQMGVVIETTSQVFGLSEQGFKTVMQRTQPEGTRSGPGDVDRTLFALRQFLRLAASGNPSVLMALWAPVVQTSSLGDELRSLAPAFVGRHVIPRYRGYMQAQALRLLGLKGGKHGRRGGGQREELISQYGYDVKFAMHAARLGIQCIELMTTGKLELPMKGEDADWLRAVRRGEVSFEEWWERALELDVLAESFINDQSIPDKPNVAAIEAFSTYAHLQWWEWENLACG